MTIGVKVQEREKRKKIYAACTRNLFNSFLSFMREQSADGQGQIPCRGPEVYEEGPIR